MSTAKPMKTASTTLKLRADPTPPDHLSEPTRAWWLQVAKDYGMAGDHVGLAGLTVAADAWDLKERARLLVEKQGAEVLDRYQTPVPNRWLRIQIQAMAEYRAAVKSMHFDIEPIRPGPGRPPGR
jgi:hypothetical protein